MKFISGLITGTIVGTAAAFINKTSFDNAKSYVVNTKNDLISLKKLGSTALPNTINDLTKTVENYQKDITPILENIQKTLGKN